MVVVAEAEHPTHQPREEVADPLGRGGVPPLPGEGDAADVQDDGDPNQRRRVAANQKIVQFTVLH